MTITKERMRKMSEAYKVLLEIGNAIDEWRQNGYSYSTNYILKISKILKGESKE